MFTPIIIRAVSNGFIVHPFSNREFGASDQETRVFETMESLQKFVEEHFEPPKSE